MQIQWRQAESEEDLHRVVEMLDLAFPDTDGDYFGHYLNADSTLHPQDTFLAEADGRVVGSVQRFPRQMVVRGKAVALAGIGNVGTHPDYRGRGIASRLLQQVLEDSRRREYDLAMLFTRIPDFFAAHGFFPVARNEFILDPLDSLSHGEEFPFQPERDLAEVQTLYEDFVANRTGCLRRSPEYWKGQLQFAGDDPELFRVLRRQGRLVAYIRGRKEEEILHLFEFAYLDNLFDALTLATRLLQETNCEKIQLPLIPEEVLLLANPVPVETYRDAVMLAPLNVENLVTGFNLWDDEPEAVIDTLFGTGEFCYWQTDFF